MSYAVYCQIEGSRRVSFPICASTSRTVGPIPKRGEMLQWLPAELILGAQMGHWPVFFLITPIFHWKYENIFDLLCQVYKMSGR